jgi:hypothetical protein
VTILVSVFIKEKRQFNGERIVFSTNIQQLEHAKNEPRHRPCLKKKKPIKIKPKIYKELLKRNKQSNLKVDHDWECHSVVEHLPSMCKALSSIPSIRKSKQMLH